MEDCSMRALQSVSPSLRPYLHIFLGMVTSNSIRLVDTAFFINNITVNSVSRTLFLLAGISPISGHTPKGLSWFTVEHSIYKDYLIVI